jgi:hypothetical protein
LLDLVRHCLYADAGPDSFAWFGEPGATPQAAWSALEEYREELPWLPTVPAPNENASDVATRLLDAAGRLNLTAAEMQLWRARALRANAGLERGETAFRELFERNAESSPPLAAAALCGSIECCLDRGAVRAARQLLDERAALLASSPRGLRLRSWVLLLHDEEAAARASESAAGAWSGRLPTSLSELRSSVPPWLPLLAGKPVAGTAAHRTSASSSLSTRSLRRSCGAVLVAAFALLEGGRSELLESDLAPALKERLADWLRAVDGACSEASAPEHRAIVAAKPEVQHRYALGGPKVTVDRGQIQAVAVAPVLDGDGEVAGWLRFEWEHHLVPSLARLAHFAAAWRERMLARRAQDAPPPSKPVDRRAAGEIDWSTQAWDGPCAEVMRALVADLAMKTAQRRWWGFEVSEGRARWIASGGGSAGDIRGSGRRALRRALRSASVVSFDEPESELAIARDSASGLALPLVWRGELCGLLAIESIRRKDFPTSLAQRWHERLQRSAVDLRIGQFREWHRARFGHDVHFAAGSGGSNWIEQVFAAARSRACCTLARTGRQWKASRRALAALRTPAAGAAVPGVRVRRRRAPTVEHRSARYEPAAARRQRNDRARRARTPLAARAGAAARPRRRRARARATPRRATLDRSHAGAAGGARRARHVARRSLSAASSACRSAFPLLADRRLELPRMVALLARRFAEEERVAAPTFDDEAIATLWRQPWTANVRELEN